MFAFGMYFCTGSRVCSRQCFLSFVESQFPCYQWHIIPTLCMPLPPLKVICKLFRSCILQTCGQCCSVCEPALPYFAVCDKLKPVLLGYRKRSLKGNGSCESICEAHAWNMRKAKKKNMLGSRIPALHFSFSWLFFFHVLLPLPVVVAFWSPSSLPSFKTGVMCPFLWESLSYRLIVSSSFLPVSLLWCASQWLLENLCHWQSGVALPLSKEIFFRCFFAATVRHRLCSISSSGVQ